jgi:hypothetical protein
MMREFSFSATVLSAFWSARWRRPPRPALIDADDET